MTNLKRRIQPMKATACDSDSVLSNSGFSPQYQYEDLLLRRNLSALAGQHRTCQRYSKKIKLFRATWGLPQEDDEPSYGWGHMPNSKRPTKGLNLQLAEPSTASVEQASYDHSTEWLRGVTMRGLAELTAAFNGKATRTNGDVTTYSFARGSDMLDVQVLGGMLACAASLNGTRLPVFSFQPTKRGYEAGIPPAIASKGWNGKLSPSDAQEYAVSWSRLIHRFKH